MTGNTERPTSDKKMVVQHEEDLYECLDGDVNQASSESLQPKSNNGVFWTTVISALLALFFLQLKDTTSTTQYLKIPSSPEPIAVHRNTN